MSMFTASDKHYAGKWEIKTIEAIADEDKKAIKSAEVVDGQYGLSVCFTMKAGGYFFKALDTMSNAKPGDAVDLETAKLVTFCRQGDADITKIRI